MGQDTEQIYTEKINQELYKRNVELAFHNKMLSLMRRLYSITITTFSVTETSQKLIQEVQKTLNLRLARIFFLKDKSGGKMALDLIASAPGIATKILGTELAKDNTVFKNVCLNRKPLVLEEAAQLFNAEYGFKGSKDARVLLAGVSAAIYPIIINNQCDGLLLIVFSKKYSELTSYEIETIENFASLTSIAVDKSKIYEELDTANKKLQVANERLKELDEQKTDFLSMASHQLRTPITIVNGYIELLKDNAYGKVTEETKGILDNMDASNQRLIKLVDEFLDVSRIEQGRTKFDFSNQDINKIVTSVVAEQTQRAKDKGMKIDWAKPKEPMIACADEEKIRHVIFNFVDNALKYSEHGTVTVKVKAEKDGLEVLVHDEGLGFGKTDENNFFQKFYRGENVKQMDASGTGLGLFVCRKFIESHKGRIWAHSAGINKGSEFGFWIPANCKV